MKVIDLTDEHKQLYFVCLEDWCEEMKEAWSHKAIWYNEMKDKGLSRHFPLIAKRVKKL